MYELSALRHLLALSVLQMSIFGCNSSNIATHENDMASSIVVKKESVGHSEGMAYLPIQSGDLSCIDIA